MNKLFCLVILAFLILSCDGQNQEIKHEIPAPKVIVSNPVPCIGEEVQFYYQSDISGNPVWDFGDGTTSTDALAKHTYITEKQYNVTLVFSDGSGGEATVHVPVEVMGKSLHTELQRLVSNPSEIWLCAHRANTYAGKQNGIPENSVEAIQQAIEAGANMVEIDVRTTSDGHFVLMHDAAITRTTNASGNVKDKTLAQLKSYKLRAANGALTNYTIPTLEEALLAGQGKIYFNLDKVNEIGNPRKLVALVDSLHMLDRALFYVSSNKETGSQIKNNNTQSLVFPWISNSTDVSYWSAKSLTYLAQIDYQATDAASLIATARAKQMVTYSNSLDDAGDNAVLQNHFSSIDKMKQIQLQIIQTDYTELIKNYLK
ncbi:glycerophosphodiester phosphodiesterase family protein [Viscerimonas tarda]